MATIGIISIGEMGSGIGQLLKAHQYHVVINASDRSELTQSRARFVEIELLPTDVKLVQECDYILSIILSGDTIKTAERIVTAAKGLEKELYYLDLSSTPPRTARYIASILASNPGIRFLDGGIIGGLPHLKAASESDENKNTSSWHCPNLILSGPNKISDPTLSQILNVHHLGDQIGAATGLKMCFGMNTKGFGAIVIQSFTTAYRLGLLSELRGYMRKYNPMALQLAEKGIVTMPPKAYRWVYEMSEMAETVAEDGGFERELFQGVSEVYRTVAEDSELGKEKPGLRSRGTTVEDVVALLSEGMTAKKLKMEYIK